MASTNKKLLAASSSITSKPMQQRAERVALDEKTLAEKAQAKVDAKKQSNLLNRMGIKNEARGLIDGAFAANTVAEQAGAETRVNLIGAFMLMLRSDIIGLRQPIRRTFHDEYTRRDWLSEMFALFDMDMTDKQKFTQSFLVACNDAALACVWLVNNPNALLLKTDSEKDLAEYGALGHLGINKEKRLILNPEYVDDDFKVKGAKGEVPVAVNNVVTMGANLWASDKWFPREANTVLDAFSTFANFLKDKQLGTKKEIQKLQEIVHMASAKVRDWTAANNKAAAAQEKAKREKNKVVNIKTAKRKAA